MEKFVFISFGGEKADILVAMVLSLGCILGSPRKLFRKILMPGSSRGSYLTALGHGLGLGIF